MNLHLMTIDPIAFEIGPLSVRVVRTYYRCSNGFSHLLNH